MKKVKPFQRSHITRETKRAITFIVSQIRKGWTAEEVRQQVENSYGHFIYSCSLYYLSKSMNKESDNGI